MKERVGLIEHPVATWAEAPSAENVHDTGKPWLFYSRLGKNLEM